MIHILSPELNKNEYYKRLSPQSQEIIKIEPSIDQNIRVIAGAGSGKTETLTLRIINILLSGKANTETLLPLHLPKKERNL